MLGLAALLSSYLYNGAKPKNSDLNYAKLISGSILVRTDFAAVANQLPKTERVALLNDPGGFASWILGIVGMSGDADKPVFERRVLKDYHVGAKKEANDEPGLKITKRDWLEMIALGSDQLSAKTNSDLKGILEGMGRLGNKLDQVGTNQTRRERSGVVMEFRRMRDSVGPDEWQDLALDVFDYIVGLNSKASPTPRDS